MREESWQWMINQCMHPCAHRWKLSFESWIQVLSLLKRVEKCTFMASSLILDMDKFEGHHKPRTNQWQNPKMASEKNWSLRRSPPLRTVLQSSGFCSGNRSPLFSYFLISETGHPTCVSRTRTWWNQLGYARRYCFGVVPIFDRLLLSLLSIFSHLSSFTRM